MLSELKDEDIIEVALEGDSNKEASMELPVHRAIYQKTKALAIVHAHPPDARRGPTEYHCHARSKINLV